MEIPRKRKNKSVKNIQTSKGEYSARILKMEIKLVVNQEIMKNEERDFPFALERCLKTGTL